ncbi:hypothetical protein ERJ75_000022500 [Trypanosoma vivax]|uniref:General transcription factor TFIIB n=1 Tax=Trypanosoma vivax (strain Y486) TaxID=1055687 RepID=G0U282_TRYVY|nr:hypothetical protein TRVL_09405 [Trypanosoma vivax]KAH8611544.1 hypothetical protein ERJ75_001016100 [Trypanosoma vivax]KAH8620827.1 hypothetical protein ERJ75_000022500 [Trypanosoma vivax]CCC50385.1 conserved hypothetical protein [Trypanosoma vivax Y486]
MSTTADYVGRNCPHCGAVDSLATDDAFGEVACTECALVVAMGLEENAFNRYNENATYDDVDRHREHGDAKLAANISGVGTSSVTAPQSTTVAAKVVLHPVMMNCMRGLQKKSGLPEAVLDRAVAIARLFVGGRRARGQRVERQQDVSAACLMIAAEEANQPIPVAEVRFLDAAVGAVELRRVEIVQELKMTESERRLRSVFAENLLTKYILKLGLQVSIYQPHCMRLLSVISGVEELAGLTVVDRIVVALLLARTENTLSWEAASSGTVSRAASYSGMSTETVYASFCAKAHLDCAKVVKVMQKATGALSRIKKAFMELSATAIKKCRDEGSAIDDVESERKRLKV